MNKNEIKEYLNTMDNINDGQKETILHVINNINCYKKIEFMSHYRSRSAAGLSPSAFNENYAQVKSSNEVYIDSLVLYQNKANALQETMPLFFREGFGDFLNQIEQKISSIPGEQIKLFFELSSLQQHSFIWNKSLYKVEQDLVDRFGEIKKNLGYSTDTNLNYKFDDDINIFNLEKIILKTLDEKFIPYNDVLIKVINNMDFIDEVSDDTKNLYFHKEVMKDVYQLKTKNLDVNNKMLSLLDVCGEQYIGANSQPKKDSNFGFGAGHYLGNTNFFSFNDFISTTLEKNLMKENLDIKSSPKTKTL